MSVACGKANTVVITPRIRVFATGFNGKGGFGLGDNTNKYNSFQSIPVTVLNTIIVKCGYYHTAAITSKGLLTTGYNLYGQLGLGNNTDANMFTYVNISGTPTLLDCGDYYTMAITSDGLFATGDNTKGQLGLSDNIQRNSFVKVPTGSSPVIAVECGSQHTMMISKTGTLSRALYGTGYNAYGQLGLGHNTDRNSFDYVQASGELTGTPISVACGSDHTMVITSDGLFATGRNYDGQLGLGDNIDRNSFVKVSSITGTLISVACGADHTMVITSDGLFATGGNSMSQLGLGGYIYRNSFVKVSSISGTPISVACGDYYTMLATTSGLFGVGYNFFGQLGLGNYSNRVAFTKVISQDIVFDTNYGLNADVVGSVSCAGVTTIQTSMQTDYISLPTFDANSIGYSASYALAAGIRLYNNISYIVPSTASTCTVQTTQANLCTLNIGVYIFLCDFQINNWGYSVIFYLYLNSTPLLVRGDNSKIKSDQVQDSNGIKFSRVKLIKVTANNSTIRCYIDTTHAQVGNNYLTGLNISITKIA